MSNQTHQSRRLALLPLGLILWVGAAAMLGCHSPATDESSVSASAGSSSPTSATADPDDQPITEADVQLPTNFVEAVRRIRAYADQIRAAIEADRPTKAHRALDELDIVLGKLMPLARDSGVPRARWESVNTAARDLRRQFDRLHAAIDDHRQPDYPVGASAIAAALTKLESVANEQSQIKSH